MEPVRIVLMPVIVHRGVVAMQRDVAGFRLGNTFTPTASPYLVFVQCTVPTA